MLSRSSPLIANMIQMKRPGRLRGSRNQHCKQFIEKYVNDRDCSVIKSCRLSKLFQLQNTFWKQVVSCWLISPNLLSVRTHSTKPHTVIQPPLLDDWPETDHPLKITSCHPCKGREGEIPNTYPSAPEASKPKILLELPETKTIRSPENGCKFLSKFYKTRISNFPPPTQQQKTSKKTFGNLLLPYISHPLLLVLVVKSTVLSFKHRWFCTEVQCTRTAWIKLRNVKEMM